MIENCAHAPRGAKIESPLIMTPAEIPDLHEIVLKALELHSSYEMPKPTFEPSKRRLVVASGNALPTGQIMFADDRAIFSDEGRYLSVLDREPEIDSAVVISASGEKHAPIIVRDMLMRKLPTSLVTCTPTSSAAALLPKERVIATRSIPEPITYNTSTYLGMVLTKT